MDTGVGHSIYSPAVTRSQLSQSRDATLNLRGTSGEIVKVLPATTVTLPSRTFPMSADPTALSSPSVVP